ncbi:peptidyl-prolyl cis-trans isomerase, partial [Acinetobacter baumannii]
QALENLSVGAISAPIVSGQGVLIFKVIDKKPAELMPFNSVKASVAQALKEQKATQLFADASDKLNNLTYTNPQSLVPAAKALGI